jgi:L-threonylcarbamoyladenylate synthase
MISRETIQLILQQTVSALEKDGVILYPTDTIWGLGCDAISKKAIEKIYIIKGRGYDKPLIVLVSSFTQLYQVVRRVHPRVDTLLHYHERPLTIIYPQAQEPYRHLAARDGSIAVRVVESGICHHIIESFGKPITSTSANLSGQPTPLKFENINLELVRMVDYTLPAYMEKDMSGKPSAIARYDANGELEFIR